MKDGLSISVANEICDAHINAPNQATYYLSSQHNLASKILHYQSKWRARVPALAVTRCHPKSIHNLRLDRRVALFHAKCAWNFYYILHHELSFVVTSHVTLAIKYTVSALFMFLVWTWMLFICILYPVYRTTVCWPRAEPISSNLVILVLVEMFKAHTSAIEDVSLVTSSRCLYG